MGRYTVIPEDTFDALQLDAGVLLHRFDIEQAAAGQVGFTDDDLVCATTGGVNPSCVPTFSDLGEDIDNVPVNMKELMHLDSWAVSLSTTGLGTSPRLIRFALGCADIDAQNGSKIIPRADLKQDDFKDLWWVGDKANGGFVAIRIMNALSTGGFSLQTTKNGKGQTAISINGHVSITDQKTVPMEFYSIDPDEEAVTYGVTQTLSNVTSSFTGDSVNENEAFNATLTAETGYTLTGATVTVSMGGVDVTENAYNDTDNTININAVTGNLIITATAVEE